MLTSPLPLLCLCAQSSSRHLRDVVGRSVGRGDGRSVRCGSAARPGRQRGDRARPRRVRAHLRAEGTEPRAVRARRLHLHVVAHHHVAGALRRARASQAAERSQRDGGGEEHAGAAQPRHPHPARVTRRTLAVRQLRQRRQPRRRRPQSARRAVRPQKTHPRWRIPVVGHNTPCSHTMHSHHHPTHRTRLTCCAAVLSACVCQGRLRQQRWGGAGVRQGPAQRSRPHAGPAGRGVGSVRGQHHHYTTPHSRPHSLAHSHLPHTPPPVAAAPAPTG